MSRGKWTPGPWRVVDGDFVYALNDAGHNRFSVSVAKYGNPRSEQQANAHLIAAAPDMAEALAYIVAWNGTDWNPDKARDMARAALAKARGEETES
jgi:hypothetical protein